MKISVELPDYDGNWLDVIWEAGSKYAIDLQGNSIVLFANKNALISLAKQMLYMAYNDLPIGSHVHLDSFFTNINNDDIELVIEKKVD